MLSPVDLSFFPSCFDALSWSADGDLAVAAGEYVQVLVSREAAEIDARSPMKV
jgi:hypothetical protein